MKREGVLAWAFSDDAPVPEEAFPFVVTTKHLLVENNFAYFPLAFGISLASSLHLFSLQPAEKGCCGSPLLFLISFLGWGG